MPLVPGGEPGVRASTRCTMFSVRSCSPQVMKIFWPVMRHAAVASAGSALVAHGTDVATRPAAR